MDKILAYTVHLGRNTSWDQTGDSPEAIDYTYTLFPYCPEYKKDRECFRTLAGYAAKQGFNTLVIDLGEAMRYDSHPEIAIKGVWTKDELAAELEYIRSLGMEPVPLVNFSAAHDIWLGKYERMVSSPEYREVCGDIIDEVCALFKAKMIHIGMDEETWEVQKHYDFATIRDDVTMFRDLAFLLDRCRKNGARPWMFCDPRSLGEGFLNVVGKDVLLSDKQLLYRRKSEDGKRWFEYPEQLAELARQGYDVLPGLNAYRIIRQTADKLNYVVENFPYEKTVGVLVYPYLFCESENIYKLMFEAAHSAGQVKVREKYWQSGAPVKMFEGIAYE